jgi:membrane protein YdbS with pleckstrin-like domain
VLFRSHDKERLLRRANLYGVIANAVLIVAVASAVLLIFDFLFDPGPAWTAAVIVALLLLWLWIVEPTLHRRRVPQREPLT